MAGEAARGRPSFFTLLTRGKILVAGALVVAAMLVDDWLRWFFLGMLAMAGVIVLLGRLGRREAQLAG